MKIKKFKHNSSKDKKKIVTKEQVRQMIKGISSNLNKYVDTYVTAAVGSTVHVYPITMPVAGSGETNVVGNALNMRGLEMRYSILDGAGVTIDSYTFRVIVYQAIAESNSVSSATDVLTYATAGNLQAITSPFVWGSKGKSFRVLDDWTDVVDSFNPQKVRTKHLSLSTPCRYDVSSAAWSNGQIYALVVVSNQGVNADMVYSLYYRMLFQDV